MHTPQSQIYGFFDTRNPLHNIAKTYPHNMCWLTVLLYAAEELGIKNDKKLHKQIARILNNSLSLLFISKENGAMYFPKKYEMDDRYIQESLNSLFKECALGMRVVRVLSDIKYPEVEQIETQLKAGRQLVTIIKNLDLRSGKPFDPNASVPNHALLITGFTNLQNGRVIVQFIDPYDGFTHQMELGINIFMQWIQYIWIVERKFSTWERISKLFKK